MKSLFLGGKKGHKEVIFSPVSVFWMVCHQDYTKTKGKDFLETWMEDGSGSRIEPVDFWCRSRNFFSLFFTL